MTPEVAFCSLAKQKYVNELIAIQSMLTAPLTLWQTTKSSIQYLDVVLYYSLEAVVDKLEQDLLAILLVDRAYRSSASKRFCLILFNSPHLVDCILNITAYGLTGLSNITKEQIKTDFDVFEKYVCNLKFQQILSGYSYQAIAAILSELTAIAARLTSEFTGPITALLNRYQLLLTTTTTTLTGCNTNSYNILTYLDYLSELVGEANNICHECGIAVDDQELTSIGNKLSLGKTVTGDWAFIMDESISDLQSRVLSLNDRISSLISKCGNGVNSESGDIPIDDLMK